MPTPVRTEGFMQDLSVMAHCQLHRLITQAMYILERICVHDFTKRYTANLQIGVDLQT